MHTAVPDDLWLGSASLFGSVLIILAHQSRKQALAQAAD